MTTLATITAILATLVTPAPAVTCGPISGDHSGWYDGHGQITLAPYVCSALSSRNPTRIGVGLFVLAHEAAHARGIMDEVAADCDALPRVAGLARRFYRLKGDGLRRAVLAARAFHDGGYGGTCS